MAGRNVLLLGDTLGVTPHMILGCGRFASITTQQAWVYAFSPSSVKLVYFSGTHGEKNDMRRPEKYTNE